MYGQMTAGSWIYIGTQGIVQGTYETFAAVAEKRFGGTLAGTLTLTGGCGGMGGAQPLAVTLNDGVCLIVDVDRARLQRRVDHRYLDEIADDLDDAVAKALQAKAERRAWSIGVVGNCAEVFPELLRRGVADRHGHRPDQRARPAVLPARGRRARGLARATRPRSPRSSPTGPARRWPGTSQAMVGVPGRAAPRSSTTATRSATRPARAATSRAFDFPGFVPGLHPAAVLRGQGPVPLGGAVRRPEGHRTPPTRRCWTCSPTTTGCRSGCAGPRSGSRSRACRPGSAGSATASGTRPGWRSTTWSPPVRSARRS